VAPVVDATVVDAIEIVPDTVDDADTEGSGTGTTTELVDDAVMTDVDGSGAVASGSTVPVEAVTAD